MRFTDAHCHLAWGIDDGIPDVNDAVKALHQAKDDGIGTIVSTPHVLPEYTDEEGLLKINERIDQLAMLAERFGIRVVRGCEFMISDMAAVWLDRGIYNRIGDTRYLLCEFDVRKPLEASPYADDMLYEIIAKGMVPVVAHVERYFEDADIDRIAGWKDMGCMIQVNRTSIAGLHGKHNERNSRKVLDAGLCHMVVSDAHRAGGLRICRLSDAYSIVDKRYGRENADLLFSRNPQLMIKDQPLEDMRKIRRKGLLGRLLGR